MTTTHDAFPRSQHLPLGRPFGMLDGNAEAASDARPFGMCLARCGAEPTPLDPSRFGYDPVTQTGTVLDGGAVIPLARHTDGKTNTITDKGDGDGTNKDSDTDHRED